MAGQPISVNQIGFDAGAQAVAAASSTPPTRSLCVFYHQPTRSLTRNTHGLP